MESSSTSPSVKEEQGDIPYPAVCTHGESPDILLSFLLFFSSFSVSHSVEHGKSFSNIGVMLERHMVSLTNDKMTRNYCDV
jgi:hypothetical protein